MNNTSSADTFFYIMLGGIPVMMVIIRSRFQKLRLISNYLAAIM